MLLHGRDDAHQPAAVLYLAVCYWWKNCSKGSRANRNLRSNVHLKDFEKKRANPQIENLRSNVNLKDWNKNRVEREKRSLRWNVNSDQT